jgi:1-acyl-sn-glycerol-3-phosphate acyltransferase
MAYKRFGVFYGFLQLIVPISFTYYFRKIKTVRLCKIPRREPMLFLSNHQNSLMDPFVVGIMAKRQIGFLARASAFKNPIVARILHSLKMKPLYRPRDGMDNLDKNEEIFEACFDVLSHHQSLTMYPEGNHDRTRHLRLFKKGFIRIAMGAVVESNFKLGVKIIPIGLNYSDHLYQGGNLLVNFGNIINVLDFADSYKINPPKAINELKKEVYNSIKELMIHIEILEYYDMIDSLREIYRSRMLRKLKLKKNKLYHDFKAVKELPEEASQLNTRVLDYNNIIKANKLKDKAFKLEPGALLAIAESALLIMLLPIFIFAFVNSFIPYFLLRYIIKNKIKDDHFYSSYKIAIGMFLYPIFYLLITIPVFVIFGFPEGMIYFTSLLVVAKIALFTRQLYRSTLLHWRFVLLKAGNKELFKKIFGIRSEIVKTVDDIVERDQIRPLN